MKVNNTLSHGLLVQVKKCYGYITDIAFTDQKYKESPNQGLSNINPCKKVKYLIKICEKEKVNF